MKFLLALLTLLAASALLPLALDWRSPFLSPIRYWALTGLVVLPLGLIGVSLWALRRSDRRQWGIRSLGSLALLVAVFGLAATVVREGRFLWVRFLVLHSEAAQREMLGRHLVVGCRDLDEVRELVRLRAIAGVFLGARNVRGKSLAEVRQEIRTLQSIREEQGLAPLWIATDQEGGGVSRLSPPLARLPALSEIVERHGDVNTARQAVRQFATTQGRELADLGVNLNFAPVVDVNHQVVHPNDRYTRIYQRAISTDPAAIAQVAAWYCSALEDAGVRCTLKHFPGLGRVAADTHLDHANLEASVAELTHTDWVPFREVMGRTRAFTMLGHVRLTAVDSDRPVSISERVIAGLVRGEWKFDGVLITDDFCMHAIYCGGGGIERAAVEALNAGVDLILISYDPDQYYRVMHALEEADRQGKLDREALKRSAQRLQCAVIGKRGNRVKPLKE